MDTTKLNEALDETAGARSTQAASGHGPGIPQAQGPSASRAGRVSTHRGSFFLPAGITSFVAVILLTGALNVLLTSCSSTGPSSRSQAPSPRPNEQIAVLDGARGPSETPAVSESSASVESPVPGPEQIRVAWKEGVSSYRSGSYKEAAEQLRTAAAGRRSDAYVHYLLGLALWKSGQNEQAEEALVRAAGLDPRSARTWINLARVRMELGNPAGALEASESAVTIDPSNGQGLHQQGRALAALGRLDEAIDSLQQGLKAEPTNGYIANTLGHVLIGQGRYEEAIPLLESARDALPEVAYVRGNLGLAYERIGQLGKASEERRIAGEIRSSSRTKVASRAEAREPSHDAETLDVSSMPVPLARIHDGDGSSTDTPRDR